MRGEMGDFDSDRVRRAAPDLLAAAKAARDALRATSLAAKDYSYELRLLNDAIEKALRGNPRRSL